MDPNTGVTLRAATADDRAGVLELVRAAYAHDAVPIAVTAEEIEEDLDDEHVVLATDVRVAVDDATGDLVGYVYTMHLPSDVSVERCYVFGRVHPAWRRRGIGTGMMTWALGRAEEQLRTATHDLPRVIRTDAFDWLEADHRLFVRMGFAPVRWFEELLRPLTDLPPEPAPDAIAGIRIIPWPAERSEELRTVKNTAFADHWGSTPTSVSHWEQLTTGHGAFAECSFAAVDGDDRMVAVCWNSRYPEDDELLGRRDGWISTLGTLPEWRGHGVASALILTSLHAFARAGLTHSMIAVDSGSPTGANRLYRSLGYEPERRSITYEIPLAP